MEWLQSITECIISKLNGTAVERAIDEEVSIMKAEVKLAELAVDIEKETSKIMNNDVMSTYKSAVARIRSKQQA